MKDKTDSNDILEGLLWERWDGQLSDADSERLQQALSEDTMAFDSERSVAALAGALTDLNPIEPPRELKQNVIDGVQARMREEATTVSWSQRASQVLKTAIESVLGPQEGRAGEMGRKQLVLAGAFAVLVIGGVLVLTQGDSVPTDELTGAIGGVQKAERYRSAQLDADDVAVSGTSADAVRYTSYDAEGYDSEGFDRGGFDKGGFDRGGFDRGGFDKGGFDKGGFDRGGFDKGGFDRGGFDKGGFDKGGFDKDGFDRGGFDKGGFDKGGFDRGGFDKGGFDKDGFDRGGFDKGGFDRGGFDKGGFDKGGFDKGGFDKGGFDKGGFDKGSMAKGGA